MGFIVNHNDKVLVTNYCQYNDQLGINALWYRVNIEDGTFVDSQDLIGAYVTAVQTLYADLQSVTAQYDGGKLSKPQDVPQPEPSYSYQPTIGTISGDPLPSQVSGIVTWRTANAGKSYRGRSYLPFPAENNNTIDEVPSSVYMGHLTSWASFVKGANLTVGVDLKTVTMELQVFSKKFNVWSPVTGYAARQKWATQRRRGQFGRPNVSPF